jgi:hypothetical protein
MPPQTFFPRIVALFGTPNRAGFNGLTLDDGRTRLFVSPLPAAHSHAERLQDTIPDPFALPAAKGVRDSLPLGKLMGQHAKGDTHS